MAAGEGDGTVDGAAELPVVGSVGLLADGALVVGGRGDVAGSDAAEEVEFGDGGVELFPEESGHGGNARVGSVLRSQTQQSEETWVRLC